MSKKRKVADSKTPHEMPNGYAGKRPRNYTSERAGLAELYEKLASDEVNERIRAALDIVENCKNNNGNGKEPSYELCKPICIRLIRGLCSNRKSARHGFFISLVEIFRLFKTSPELKNGCLELIRGHTNLEQGGDGQVRTMELYSTCLS